MSLKCPWGFVGTQARDRTADIWGMTGSGTPASPCPGPRLHPLPFTGSAALRQPALPGTGDHPRRLYSVLFIMQVYKYIIYYFSYYYPLFIT